MIVEKTKMYVLELDGIKAIYFDLRSLKDALEMEFERYSDDEGTEMEFKVYSVLMTDKEIDELPEFDGF